MNIIFGCVTKLIKCSPFVSGVCARNVHKFLQSPSQVSGLFYEHCVICSMPSGLLKHTISKELKACYYDIIITGHLKITRENAFKG